MPCPKCGKDVEFLFCDTTEYATYAYDREEYVLDSCETVEMAFRCPELYADRLGGGASDIRVEDYEIMPTPDLSNLSINFPATKLQSREPLPYYEEVKQPDRRELDKAVLRALGFPEHELDTLVDELHRVFVCLVEDRLIKAGRPLQRLEEEEHGEDN